MEKVRPWCGQPSDRGRLKNRTWPYLHSIFSTLFPRGQQQCRNLFVYIVCLKKMFYVSLCNSLTLQMQVSATCHVVEVSINCPFVDHLLG